jgi:ATP-dependent Zn protease
MATHIARELVEVHGLGSENLAPLNARGATSDRQEIWGIEQRDRLDSAINTILDLQRLRCASILKAHKDLVEALAEILLEKQSIEAGELSLQLKAKGKEIPVSDSLEGRHI